ncbi:hypothetical protein Btru_061887 [Bulinus truncatus]|nr:hypothetical protein Btru_061887 [Bulinus truncatus]
MDARKYGEKSARSILDSSTTKVRTDSEVTGMTIENSRANKLGSSSFKINSVDQSSINRRQEVSKRTNSNPNSSRASLERTSSISYKPPSFKKKSSVSPETVRVPGTMSTAFGYITSPARFIGSFFTSKKEPMVVKSAPALNKEKVKIISSSQDQVKDSIADIMTDNEPSPDKIASPTILTASNTALNNTSTMNTTKKSENKSEIKRNSSSNVKRSVSQTSKHATKSRVSPIVQKDKKSTSPVLVSTESKTIPVSNVKIAVSSKSAFKVTSKNKEETPLKSKKDIRKTSPTRQSRNPGPSLPSNGLGSKKVSTTEDKQDDIFLPTMLTAMQPHLSIKSMQPGNKSNPEYTANMYPPQFKIMLGGPKNYDVPETPSARQLSNKCNIESNLDNELTPTFLTPTCLENDFIDTSESIPIVSLSANSLVNNSVILAQQESNVCSLDTSQSNIGSSKTNKSFIPPSCSKSPVNIFLPYKVTSPEQPKRSGQSKRFSPSYRLTSVSPQYNKNENFQPQSPTDSKREPDVQAASVVTSSQSSAIPPLASYRVMSPNRLVDRFTENTKSKFRSVSRSPNRSSLPYSNNPTAGSYSGRHSGQHNQPWKKSPNTTRPLHGSRRMSKKEEYESDNPVIIVMPGTRFKEFNEAKHKSDAVEKKITPTNSGSYKVSTKSLENVNVIASKTAPVLLGTNSTVQKSNESLVVPGDPAPTSPPKITDSDQLKEIVSANKSEEITSTEINFKLKEQPQYFTPEVDISQSKPSCKGLRMKSTDRLSQAAALSSKLIDGKKLLEENVGTMMKRKKTNDVDHFNSLEQYGGNPAQHAAATTMLGEFP